VSEPKERCQAMVWRNSKVCRGPNYHKDQCKNSARPGEALCSLHRVMETQGLYVPLVAGPKKGRPVKHE
jgi:hypothetical protein